MGMTVNSMAGNELQKNFIQFNAANKIGTKSVAEDSAGAAIVEGIIAQARGLEQGSANTADMSNLVSTAEGALSGISDGLQRVQELTVQANSGILTDDDKGIIQNEVNQILQGVSDTVANTAYNNQNLLDGTFTNRNTASGADGTGMQVTIGDMSLEALGLDDFNVTSSIALDSVKTAIDTVAAQRSSLGSVSNTFAHTINSNDITGLNLASARSGIADTDMAKLITESKKEQVLDEYRMNMQNADTEQRQQILGTLLP